MPSSWPCGKAVGILDQTSFGKLRVRGRDAAALLDRVCANTIGKLTYTAMLNRKGGFESDVTVQRWSDDDFLVVTGSAQPVRDRAWLLRHKNADEDVTRRRRQRRVVGAFRARP